MEWEPFVEEGLIVPCDGKRAEALPLVNVAWKGVTRARHACEGFQWDVADVEAHDAMALAGDSLCLYYGYRFAEPPTFEGSQRICSAFFKPGIADAVFERAGILEGMMPLPNEELDPDLLKRARHSVGASAELCAMVESFVYFS